jgi:DNA-binding winged helix-turn-helix (wHTH) protein
VKNMSNSGPTGRFFFLYYPVQSTMPTSHGAVPESVFRFGEFTFDSPSRLLTRGETQQHLSPKALQMLRLLLIHRSRAVSRKELYDALWPSTFVCETNLATVVSELRRVLRDAASAQYIRTIHGFGYAFAGDVSCTLPQLSAIATLFCERQRHPLFLGENSIGRAEDCRIVLAGATVSRRHAAITVVRGELWIEDLGSTNGTYVGGKRVTRALVRYQEPILFGGVDALIARNSRITLPLPGVTTREQLIQR